MITKVQKPYHYNKVTAQNKDLNITWTIKRFHSHQTDHLHIYDKFMQIRYF